MRARTATERAFLAIGNGAAVWLKEATAVGSERIIQKMRDCQRNGGSDLGVTRRA
jgi:hypothetical protein